MKDHNFFVDPIVPHFFGKRQGFEVAFLKLNPSSNSIRIFKKKFEGTMENPNKLLSDSMGCVNAIIEDLEGEENPRFFRKM